MPMVPKKGLEPPHPCEYMDLNHARLPIPPLRHGLQRKASGNEPPRDNRYRLVLQRGPGMSNDGEDRLAQNSSVSCEKRCGIYGVKWRLMLRYPKTPGRDDQ